MTFYSLLSFTQIYLKCQTHSNLILKDLSNHLWPPTLSKWSRERAPTYAGVKTYIQLLSSHEGTICLPLRTPLHAHLSFFSSHASNPHFPFEVAIKTSKSLTSMYHMDVCNTDFPGRRPNAKRSNRAIASSPKGRRYLPLWNSQSRMNP